MIKTGEEVMSDRYDRFFYNFVDFTIKTVIVLAAITFWGTIGFGIYALVTQ